MLILTEEEKKLASWIIMGFLMGMEKASQEEVIEVCAACPSLSGCDVNFPTCERLFNYFLGIDVCTEVQ